MSDFELMAFAKWYVGHFGRRDAAESVFITCMCGYFQSYPNAMSEALKRMKALRLVTINNHIVTMA